MNRNSTQTVRALALCAALALLIGGSPVSAAPTGQADHPILLTDPVPDPHTPGVVWFAATGHTLRGDFLDYWTRFATARMNLAAQLVNSRRLAKSRRR